MSELDELAQLLLMKTSQGKLKWRLESDSLITSRQGENLIEVVEGIIDRLYTLTLRNKNGLKLASNDFQENNPSFEAIRDTFAQVKRYSLGVDQALTDMKQRLMSL